MSEQSNENFIPQIEEMDFSEYLEKQFIVAVSVGPRDDGRFLCKTVRGPYTFDEMVGEVIGMWQDEQNNAKVTILNKGRKVKPEWFDAKTTDYLQARGNDILMERMLGGIFDKKYTCAATVVSQEDPKPVEQEETV